MCAERVRDEKGDDDDLFMALYGEDAPLEQRNEETAKVVFEAPALDEEVARALERDAAGRAAPEGTRGASGEAS